MTQRIILSVIILLGVNSIGCTNVTVKPAKQNTDGLRYYLPQPFLIVTPQEDGSIEARVESIADRQQAYAVSAMSGFASHKLVVKLDQGLLEEVSMTQDSSSVVAETVKAAGELQKSKIEAKTAAATKASEKQEAASKARQEERKKLQDALLQADLELAEAEAERDTTTDTTMKQSAIVAVAKAQAKVDMLRRQLSSAEVNDPTFSSLSAPDRNNQAPPPQAPGFKKTTRPGPVVFRIEENAASGVLQLVPVNFEETAQKTFETYEGPQKSAGEQTAFEFETSSPMTVKVGTVSVKKQIKTKIDLATLKVAKMEGPQGAITHTWWPGLTRKDSKTFELTFKETTPPNTYEITFSGQISGDSPTITGTLSVIVTQ